MKTVKTLQKVNIIFLLMILLMALATVFNHAFGQKNPKWEQSQSYGDSALVDMSAIFVRDSAAIELPYDNTIREIVVLCYPDGRELDEDKQVWVMKNPRELVDITFYGVSYTFIKTNRGVTCLYYVYDEEHKEGVLAVNGKISARYIWSDDFGKRRITADLGGLTSDLWKDRIFWRYGTGRP